MIDLKKFFKVSKHYINYLMKLGFKDLFINFIELVILVALSFIVYLPVELIRGLLYKIMVFFVTGSTTLYFIFDVVFNLIAIILCVCCFIYLFNKRYEDIEGLRNSRQEKMFSNNSNNNKSNNYEEGFRVRESEIKEEFELPKAKVEKKKFH